MLNRVPRAKYCGSLKIRKIHEAVLNQENSTRGWVFSETESNWQEEMNRTIGGRERGSYPGKGRLATKKVVGEEKQTGPD